MTTGKATLLPVLGVGGSLKTWPARVQTQHTYHLEKEHKVGDEAPKAHETLN